MNMQRIAVGAAGGVLAVALLLPTVAGAVPAKCEAAARNGAQAVLDSPVCTGAQGSGEDSSPDAVPMREHGPAMLGVYDPDHELDGPHYGDTTFVPNPAYAEGEAVG
jgi:hypothetical protein